MEQTTAFKKATGFENVENVSKNELFDEIFSFQERENKFLSSLIETINLSESDQEIKDSENECNSFINPLLARTSSTISTLISTKNAIDQLDSLHQMVHQLLAIQETNLHLRESMNIVQTLKAIKTNTVNVSKVFQTFSYIYNIHFKSICIFI